MSPAEIGPSVLERMRCEWDERARENARHFIATAHDEWNTEEFFNSGRLNLFFEILTDLGNVCQGKSPKDMKVLEIGCGAGRMTRAAAEVFGEVYAVDISGEMIAKAREALADMGNVHLVQNSGADLQVLGRELQVDFVFSFIVFQHIPSREVIYSYAREVHRVLRPGGLFKFQVQGAAATEGDADTWLGVHFTDEDAVEMAHACGFEPRHRHGADTQCFWLWFFKPGAMEASKEPVSVSNFRAIAN